MNRNDRELLARMMTVNKKMGEVILGMLGNADGGRLRSADVRSVGRELALLGADMMRYTTEMVGIIESVDVS